MSKMRKIFAMALITVLTAGLLTGCANKDQVEAARDDLEGRTLRGKMTFDGVAKDITYTYAYNFDKIDEDIVTKTITTKIVDVIDGETTEEQEITYTKLTFKDDKEGSGLIMILSGEGLKDESILIDGDSFGVDSISMTINGELVAVEIPADYTPSYSGGSSSSSGSSSYGSNSYDYSSGSSSSSQECYVCGSAATQKVGSYWYCSSCASIVKGASGELPSDYAMPNESDESFTDYVKRVDPDLYDEMVDIYEGLE